MALGYASPHSRRCFSIDIPQMTKIGVNDSILAGGTRKPKGGVRRGPDHSREAELVFFLVIHTHVVIATVTTSNLWSPFLRDIFGEGHRLVKSFSLSCNGHGTSSPLA